MVFVVCHLNSFGTGWLLVNSRGGLYEVLTTFPSSILTFFIFSEGGEGGLGGRGPRALETVSGASWILLKEGDW